MKDRRIQTRRKAKSGFRALYAKTMERKHRASAAIANPDDIEGDIPKVGIGRALTVILILHIVAIAAIYMGTKWKGSDPAGQSAVAIYDKNSDESSSAANADQQHKFKVSQPRSYEGYQRNSEVSHEMPETVSSRNVINSPKEISTPAEQNATTTRKPRVILPKRNPNAHVNLPSPSQQVSYKTHTIVSGDTIYRIALKNKVKQQEILDLNKITDARKIRVGMVIKVPVK